MDGKISDEIRELVKRSEADGYVDTKVLLALANRIDAEMFELSCGHTVEMTFNKPPAYCTECGARVIRRA